MVSKRKMKMHSIRKTNPYVKDTAFHALKSKAWGNLAKMLSASTRVRKKTAVNLSEIDAKSKAGDTILVPGKVLALGDLTKKVKICALSISGKAREKLKATKSEFVAIKDEIKSNPKAEGIKVIQ
jgi:large subunit ribosomal protein L18e